MTVQNSPTKPHNSTMKVWEYAIAWLAVILAIVGVGYPLYVILSQWDYMMYVMRGQKAIYFGMALPFIFLAGSILLLLKNRYSLVVLFAHLVLSCAFAAFTSGLSSLPPYLYLSYLFEIGLVYLSYSLLCRGVFSSSTVASPS